MWLFIPVVTVLFAISIVKLAPKFIWKHLNCIGVNSMFVFCIHPIVREIVLSKVFFLGIKVAILFYLIATLMLVLLVKLFLKLIPRLMFNKSE